MDETELERLSFLVYKKAMALIGYTGGVLALGLVLFAFFGFNKWKDLSAVVEGLEQRTREAQQSASEAQNDLSGLKDKSAELSAKLAENEEVFQKALEGALIQTGRMQQAGDEAAGLAGRIDKQEEAALKRIEMDQRSNKDNLDSNLERLQDELQLSAKSRADSEIFKQSINQTSADLSAQVVRSLDAGSTILVLQDKHSTSISANDSDIKIALGDARRDGVHGVEIDSGGGGPDSYASRKLLKPNEEITFSRVDPHGKSRKYTFRVLDINMLVLRDLVTCELRWELDKSADKVAQTGG